MRRLRAHLTRRLADQRGFTMLLALSVMAITAVLVSGAFIAVLGDTQLSRNNVDQARAYAAAQAGIQAYNYELNQNESYWETCDTIGPKTVPQSSDAGGSESYYVTPMPASTAPASDDQCDSNNALTTMIEGASAGSAAGTFRIKSTGTSNGVQRTIVAQYKPPSFLDYVYYTDYETTDPSALPNDPSGCAVHYPNRNDNQNSAGYCGGPIDFVTGDDISGPLHSEDTLAICGAPVFGRSGDDDAVEAAGPSAAPNGWYTPSGCSLPRGQSSDPTFNTASGKINTDAPSITPPSDDSQLLSVVQSNYHYTGRTTIQLNGSTMSVSNSDSHNTGLTGSSVPLPSSGVIYVSTDTSGCGVTYTPYDSNYTGDTDCGNVYVSGTYSSSLTIASDNDIIITGNLCPTGSNCEGAPTGNALLGLIANDFVRIYHPLNNASDDTENSCASGQTQATASTSDLTNPTVYAAILAVNHSFIVDNYNCGGTGLGTLTVWGAIAQLFRGPVGTLDNNGNIASGYTKSYNYDERLASEEPPYFLDPAQAQWQVSRETECDNTSTC